MEIALVGPWVVLAVGSVTVLGAVWLTVARPQEKRPLYMWVFGVLLVGVGTYGPAFLSDYIRFVKVVMRMEEDPGPESYGEFLEDMAQGDVPERLQAVGTAVMLQHPIPELEGMLERAAGRAEEPEVRVRILSAQDALQAEKRQARISADQFLQGHLDRETLFGLPESVRFHVSEELERAPDDVRVERALGAEDLQRLRGSALRKVE